jgi:hypothetical protein
VHGSVESEEAAIDFKGHIKSELEYILMQYTELGYSVM